MLGGFATTALTALTAQNTREVTAIHPVPATFVRQQIDTIYDDMTVDAVKTGMLHTAETVAAVADSLRAHEPPVVVVDPVMVATSGACLLAQDAIDVLTQRLLPCADLITPNLAEAAALCGREVHDLDGMRAAAQHLSATGVRAVLITGGHAPEACTDLLFDGRQEWLLSGPRIDTPHTHGTGCGLSAAIATLLAQGLPLGDACHQAKQCIANAIRHGHAPGGGPGPINACAPVVRDAWLHRCAQQLTEAIDRLCDAQVGWLIPEIQSNFGYALPEARDADDIVAIPGRIIRFDDSLRTLAPPRAGASRHIARIILTLLRVDPRFRAVMNICWSPALVEACRSAGLHVQEFDRRQEPDDVKQVEGSTLEWGTRQVLDRTGTVPDVIFDTGDIGKEPVCRVIGTDPADVADKILTIAQEYQNRC